MEEQILTNLCNKAKIDRDKGYQQIVEYLKSVDHETALSFEQQFLDLLADSTCEWETKHGALMGLKAFCRSELLSEDLSSEWLAKALLLADDSEFRVRIAAGLFILSLHGMISWHR